MKIKRLFCGLIALGLVTVSLPCYGEEATATPAADTTTAADTATDAAAAETAAVSSITTNSIDGWPQGADITSTAAVVMEDSTNTILYAKNMDETLFPGSTVKVMTTLLALENSQLTDSVTMTATGVSGVTDGGTSISAQLDEVFTMEQCLYAIMLASANDIALQVAEHIGGSVDGFVQMMNEKASELGCTDTVFTNPTGLPDEAQHTTAHDTALIMKAAIDNENFRTIAGTSNYTIPQTNVSGGERNLTNNFALMTSTDANYYQYCIGGKEGYTQASQSTLVCGAEKDGMTLVAVVLSGVSGTTAAEAVSLLEYGFNNFQLMDLSPDDFNMVSGGIICVPNGTVTEQLTVQDGEVTDGQYSRQYYFGGTPVGTALMASVEQTDDTLAIQGEQNLEEARQYSATDNNVPYIAIAGAGVVVLLLILWRIIRVAKS